MVVGARTRAHAGVSHANRLPVAPAGVLSGAAARSKRRCAIMVTGVDASLSARVQPPARRHPNKATSSQRAANHDAAPCVHRAARASGAEEAKVASRSSSSRYAHAANVEPRSGSIHFQMYHGAAIRICALRRAPMRVHVPTHEQNISAAPLSHSSLERTIACFLRCARSEPFFWHSMARGAQIPIKPCPDLTAAPATLRTRTCAERL